MRRFFAIVVLAILTPFGLPSARGQEFASEMACCAWVRAENDGAGAGFVLDAEKKLLVTCRHLVAERTKVDVIFPWIREGEFVTDRSTYLGNRALLRERGLLVTGKVLKTSDELDLALMELESLPADVRAATLASEWPSPGDSLRVIGNRLDLDTVWNLTKGPVRATGRLTEGYFWRGKKLAANAETIIGQLPTEEGDSGGPVFNAEGKLVGMASALRRQCPQAAVVITVAEIRKFAGLPEAKKDRGRPKDSPVVEAVMRGTVWVRPAATDIHLAGVLIEKDLVLTCGKGLRCGDRAGVAFPIREGNRWLLERLSYKDSVGLALRGFWRSGVVLALDPDRDLALLRLETTPESCRPIVLSTRLPVPGDNIHALNHPSGLEFAWVYSSGAVRQVGKVVIAHGENAKKIATIVCQLPAQAGSPGGPVVNDQGELLGILSAKESTQQVGYAVKTEEIAAFLDSALTDRVPRTLDGLLARIEELPHRIIVSAAQGLALKGQVDLVQGRLGESKRDCDKALSLDPSCVKARLCRAAQLEPEAALKELDIAVEKGPYHRDLLHRHAKLAFQFKDWRKARGDLERIVDVDPLDAEARQLLVGVLLELHEDAKAVAAVSDTLRADPKRMPAMAADLLAQAEALAKKFPDAPSIPSDWLVKTLTAAESAISDPVVKSQLSDLLKRAADIAGKSERLTLLREELKKCRLVP